MAQDALVAAPPLRSTFQRPHIRLCRIWPHRSRFVEFLIKLPLSNTLDGLAVTATLVRMMPYQPSKVLYLTSKPGKPASEDYYGLIKESKVPIQPAQSVEELAKEVDLLFVCCALTDSTKGMIGEDFISKMKVS